MSGYIGGRLNTEAIIDLAAVATAASEMRFADELLNSLRKTVKVRFGVGVPF